MSKILYYCELCNVSYISKKQYDKHLQRKKHKKMLDEPTVCKLCAKLFTTKPNRDKHLRKIHHINPDVENIINITQNDKEEDDKIVDKKDKYDKELDLLKMVYELKNENSILKLKCEKDNVILKLEKDNQIQKEQFEKEL